MIKRDIKVAVTGGIHAVPSVRIYSIITEHGVTARLECKGNTSDGNCLQTIKLRAGEGDYITAILEGEREEEAMDALEAYLSNTAI